MKKFLIVAGAALLLVAQGALANEAATPSGQQAMAKGNVPAAMNKEDRALHQRHGAERAKLRKQHGARNVATDQRRKDWQDLSAKHHQERRAMAERHADQAKNVDKAKMLQEMDDMEKSHANERSALADKLNKEGATDKARRQQFEKLHAKQRKERQRLYQKHFGTSK
ncbi:MAG: hypothetical protein AB7U30_09485 [Sulfuricellaceae bacterium]|jgi:hypothetical protein